MNIKPSDYLKPRSKRTAEPESTIVESVMQPLTFPTTTLTQNATRTVIGGPTVEIRTNSRP